MSLMLACFLVFDVFLPLLCTRCIVGAPALDSQGPALHICTHFHQRQALLYLLQRNPGRVSAPVGGEMDSGGIVFTRAWPLIQVD